MTYTVTSDTMVALSRHTVNDLVRKFTVGGSDYSSFVEKWPRFRKAWNDIKPGDLSLKLNNVDKTFNFFREEPTKMRSACLVQLGVGSDLMTYFSGMVDRVRYDEGTVTINLTDKFKQLSQRNVGTNEAPVDFTGSSYLVSDFAWYLCTSYGGLSAVQSTSNPDIDYSSFLTWASVFSSDSVKVKAYLDGLKVNEALRTLGRITESAIFVSNGKISFHRYSIGDTPADDYSPHDQLSLTLEVRDDDVVNKQIVQFDYSVTSKYFTKSVFTVSSSSINSYGLREEVEKDDKIWYVDSTSSLNYCQRVITFHADPYDRIETSVPPFGLLRDIGDTVTITDSHLNFSRAYRIMEVDVDMQDGSVGFTVDRSQFVSGFKLDVSALDGTDVLT